MSAFTIDAATRPVTPARLCIVTGCVREPRTGSADYCDGHYQRIRRTGGPGGPSFRDLGGPAAKRERRAQLRQFVVSHLAGHPQAWLSTVDLARLIRERHLSEPKQPGHGRYHYGRSNVLTAIFAELEAEGLARPRPHPGKRGAVQWQAIPPDISEAAA